MTSTLPPSWDYVRYALQDGNGNPATDALALPTHSATDTATSSAKRRPAPIVTRLCTLPPVKLGQRIPPNLIEPYDGCSPPPSLSRIERVCQSNARTESINCAWRVLAGELVFTADSGEVDPFRSGYCLPLDDPVLADRGIVPVPMPNVTTSHSFGPELEKRIVPTLKHFLESRNHPAVAAFPAFANVTVRPSHKRLRLGICTTFPPINSPCSLAAVDTNSGTVAPGWLFPSPGNYDDPNVLLAHPQSAFTSMVGARINTLDHAATSLSLAQPFPFLTANAKSHDPKWQYLSAWSSPLIKCAATSNSTTIGLARPLIISGPCTSNRDCLSGTCLPHTNTCDHESRNRETNSPFSASFMINRTMPGGVSNRFLTYPPTKPARDVLYSFGTSGMDSSYLPSDWVYYTPVIVVVGAIGGIVLLALIWMRGAKIVERVRQKWTGWRSTTERDIQLKPVSGRMVADLGDERAVREAVEAGEELPMYVRAETRGE